VGSSEVANLLRVIREFEGRRVLVVGDLVADEYVFGQPERVSREAPVLILKYLSQETRLGGAANACHNLLTLGAKVVPLGVVGADAAGEALRRALIERGIPVDGVVPVPSRPTPVKTRILGGGWGSRSARQQIVRVDREPEGAIPPGIETLLVERLHACAGKVDAVVLSDYGYGTITPRILAEIRAMEERGVIVTADSRYDLLRFDHLTAATPSESEVEHLLGTSLDGDKAVEQAGWQLLERLGARCLLVTRGAKGLALFEKSGDSTFVPIFGSDEIADVTGAGDTVISTFTLALASGARPVEAARLSNYAGGLVVMKRGTATVSRDELAEAVRRDLGSGTHDGASARS
jgi:D-glycero-beta-D-manno-heptose-7-phosphate kinase